MALWKPFRGSRADLDTVPKHDGYVYFCDDGSLHFDYTDANGVLQRKQINAKEAESLIGYDIVTLLNSSDATIPTSKAVLDAIAGKADKDHTHNDIYYTKNEIDNLELITIDDIDTICGGTISYASLSEGAF